MKILTVRLNFAWRFNKFNQKLTEEMETAAENLEFERAASIRDIIKSVRKMSDKQKVVATKLMTAMLLQAFRMTAKPVIRYFDLKAEGCLTVKALCLTAVKVNPKPKNFTAILHSA